MTSVRTLILLFLIISLSGCWSSRDIEKLDLLLGVGIDEAQGIQDDKLLTVTYQFAKVSNNQSTNNSAQSPKPFSNVEVTGNSILETARDVIQKRKNIINGHHQQLIIISSKVAEKRNLRELVDFFIRDPEARMSCLVMVTEDQSKSLMEVTDSEIPTLYITDMTRHMTKSNKIIEPMPLSKINAQIEEKSSFLLQNIVRTDNNELMLKGAAVISGDTLKMIGSLNEEELEGVSWLTAYTDGGIIKFHDEDSDAIIVYELESIDSRIKPKLSNGVLSFKIETKLSGAISELASPTHDITNEDNIQKLEKQIEEKVNSQIENSLEKLQKELQADVIGLHDYVRIKYPKYWKAHKENWDSQFGQTEIDYSVDVEITEFHMNIGS
ncbi:MAG: Ger(x)C family spore germination protein [Bacillota bacterium]